MYYFDFTLSKHLNAVFNLNRVVVTVRLRAKMNNIFILLPRTQLNNCYFARFIAAVFIHGSMWFSLGPAWLPLLYHYCWFLLQKRLFAKDASKYAGGIPESPERGAMNLNKVVVPPDNKARSVKLNARWDQIRSMMWFKAVGRIPLCLLCCHTVSIYSWMGISQNGVSGKINLVTWILIDFRALRLLSKWCPVQNGVQSPPSPVVSHLPTGNWLNWLSSLVVPGSSD